MTFISFVLLHIAPGDPAQLIAGEGATAEDIEAVRVKLGLDGRDERAHFSSKEATEFKVSPDGRWVAFREGFKAFIGAFAMRGAGCTWNDIVDRDLDGLVERVVDDPAVNERATLLLLAQGMLADMDEARCRALAAALEASSTHPLARAFRGQGNAALQAGHVGQAVLASSQPLALDFMRSVLLPT